MCRYKLADGCLLCTQLHLHLHWPVSGTDMNTRLLELQLLNQANCSSAASVQTAAEADEEEDRRENSVRSSEGNCLPVIK